MQYDLFLAETHIGGISAIGDAALLWVEGYQFRYPYHGKKREFMVKTLTQVGTRIKVELQLGPGERDQPGHGPR